MAKRRVKSVSNSGISNTECDDISTSDSCQQLIVVSAALIIGNEGAIAATRGANGFINI
jgi:hypothetical protein